MLMGEDFLKDPPEGGEGPSQNGKRGYHQRRFDPC